MIDQGFGNHCDWIFVKLMLLRYVDIDWEDEELSILPALGYEIS